MFSIYVENNLRRHKHTHHCVEREQNLPSSTLKSNQDQDNKSFCVVHHHSILKLNSLLQHWRSFQCRQVIIIEQLSGSHQHQACLLQLSGAFTLTRFEWQSFVIFLGAKQQKHWGLKVLNTPRVKGPHSHPLHHTHKILHPSFKLIPFYQGVSHKSSAWALNLSIVERQLVLMTCDTTTVPYTLIYYNCTHSAWRITYRLSYYISCKENNNVDSSGK
jgi:hypothetical protein